MKKLICLLMLLVVFTGCEAGAEESIHDYLKTDVEVMVSVIEEIESTGTVSDYAKENYEFFIDRETINGEPYNEKETQLKEKVIALYHHTTDEEKMEDYEKALASVKEAIE